MSSHERTPARFVLQRPDGEELVYGLDQGRSVTLGRDTGNTIVFASQFVSKRHALVSWTPRGVRIEDQDSANGITVNGLTVHAAQLSSGDMIQIGDQHLVFEVEGHASVAAPEPGWVAPGGGNKGLRLILAAVLTMLVMVGGLATIYVMFLAPAVEQATPTSTAVREDPSLPSDTKITPFDSPQAQAIEQQAIAAHDKQPVDWLYDEGQLAYKNGRLLDAYRLLNGALLRDPQHESARRLLLKVMGERELRLNSLKAAAARADEELKFEEAAQQWEAVQALTLDNEPLNARARTEAARLRQRAAQ
ncbi:ABC transporter ATP-binding/permease protein [Luteitalea pratensis]|uniref:ABC transporter ATP-binding/permease protein n=1 Tax=Luteitalea pratensis TaxID=1855912 RepID=A0A143PGL6_LUTPR|nr:FHA domain-containing protein [Luteitalea pratensis]AMY07198.1 ABC transporter ATP-binding/permease protein [Luteitalea pratensis]